MIFLVLAAFVGSARAQTTDIDGFTIPDLEKKIQTKTLSSEERRHIVEDMGASIALCTSVFGPLYGACDKTITRIAAECQSNIVQQEFSDCNDPRINEYLKTNGLPTSGPTLIQTAERLNS